MSQHVLETAVLANAKLSWVLRATLLKTCKRLLTPDALQAHCLSRPRTQSAR